MAAAKRYSVEEIIQISQRRRAATWSRESLQPLTMCPEHRTGSDAGQLNSITSSNLCANDGQTVVALLGVDESGLRCLPLIMCSKATARAAGMTKPSAPLALAASLLVALLAGGCGVVSPSASQTLRPSHVMVRDVTSVLGRRRRSRTR